MSRRITSPAAVVAPTERPTATAAAAAGTLRVAQREVSRLLHAAILSRNRIRAGKHIQAVFRRQKEPRNNNHDINTLPPMSHSRSPAHDITVLPPPIDTSPSVHNSRNTDI